MTIDVVAGDHPLPPSFPLRAPANDLFKALPRVDPSRNAHIISRTGAQQGQKTARACSAESARQGINPLGSDFDVLGCSGHESREWEAT